MATEYIDFLSCYYDNARLWIYEPLLAGSHLPDTEYPSFASLSRLEVSIHDVFTHFTAALKAWVKSWLTVPVCSYFYMSQPAYIQLAHGAMMPSRWVRIAGSSAFKCHNVGTTASQQVSIITGHPTPALSGVPSCPNLSLPEHPSSPSTHIESARILKSLRAAIVAQSDLQVDILNIIDVMVARFEAARKEMTAAQGVDWENDTWEYAADHLRMKKARIKKWSETIAVTTSEERSPLRDATESFSARSGGCVDILPEQSTDDFTWEASDYDWVNMRWESALFDEMMQDIY